MANLHPEDAKRILLYKRLQEMRAQDAAEELRDVLLLSLHTDSLPDVPRETSKRARRAKPFGEFPSHRTLMLCYGDLL